MIEVMCQPTLIHRPKLVPVTAEVAFWAAIFWFDTQEMPGFKHRDFHSTVADLMLAGF